MDGSGFGADTVAEEGFTGGGGGLGRRIWRNLGDLRKWTVGGN